MPMHEFVIPRNAMEEQAAIHIAAPPEEVAATYRDVEHWGDTFPATIESARVTRMGSNWKQIEVDHRLEGRVPNTLVELSPTVIGLKESKKKFDASFLNQFEPAANGGTRYVIHAYIRPKGIYKLLKPFLGGYVHRQALKQMNHYVLAPLKVAVEEQVRSQPKRKR